MYRDFFGLVLSPFNNTPDPRFFFNTPDHEEAVASLIYTAQERKGFALLTGEVGSGKTLISRLAQSRLERSAKIAVVHNTRIGPRELLFSICRKFDVRVASDAAAPQMSRALEEFLLDLYAQDRLAVVIVDEAQHLTAESFEELRLLGNLEASDAKLMSVLILGQPELQETFQTAEMRQLQQRLFCSFHLKALSREMTDGYIMHRLSVAGIPKGQGVFDRSALDAVFGVSGGIPRLINQVCDGALLAAYTRSAKRVTAALVAQAVEQSRASVGLPRTNTTHRISVETGHAEDAVSLLEDRTREAANSSERVRKSIEESLGKAHQTMMMVREQSSASLGELRETMTQINERANIVRRDLVGLGDQVKHGSARSVEGLKQMVAGLLQQIDARQLGFRTEVEQASARMGQAEQQIRRAIAAARDSAKEVMVETKAQAEAIQSHARTSATTMQEQAACMMAEARNVAEQMREQAEATVRRADATAESTCRDLQDLRSDLREDRDQVREQILESKLLIAAAKDEAARLIERARTEASRLINEAGRNERESQARAERLLLQARESEGRAESLLRMPRELIDEANARAAALAEMSRTVSSVVAHLGAAGDAAKTQTRDIREAGTLAEERLELLKQHTARVGQLVGIIRQLYGVMDARIEGLRTRLDQADELCRSVPNEIDSLRSVLTDGRTKRGMALDAEPATPAEPGKRRPVRGKMEAKGSTSATSRGPVGQGTLGDIVSRNRKLHEWLRQTLREAEADEAAGTDTKAAAAARCGSGYQPEKVLSKSAG